MGSQEIGLHLCILMIKSNEKIASLVNIHVIITDKAFTFDVSEKIEDTIASMTSTAELTACLRS